MESSVQETELDARRISENTPCFGTDTVEQNFYLGIQDPIHRQLKIIQM